MDRLASHDIGNSELGVVGTGRDERGPSADEVRLTHIPIAAVEGMGCAGVHQDHDDLRRRSQQIVGALIWQFAIDDLKSRTTAEVLEFVEVAEIVHFTSDLAQWTGRLTLE